MKTTERFVAAVAIASVVLAGCADPTESDAYQQLTEELETARAQAAEAAEEEARQVIIQPLP